MANFILLTKIINKPMRLTIIITLSLFSFFTYGQKQIIIIHTFQTVPKGKVWKLEQNMRGTNTIVEISKGERCTSQEFFNPNLLGYLVSIDSTDKMTRHIIVGDSLTKVPYANEFTYSSKLYGAVKPNNSQWFHDMINQPHSKVWFIGWFEFLEPLTFTEGTTVSTTDCLKSIQLIEYSAN